MAFAGSVQGGAAPFTYSWSFGDGGTASGTLTPSHVYADNGTYTVTLTVTDGLGRSSRSSTTATVANVPPAARPGGPYSAAPGAAVAFAGSATDPGSADTSAGFSYAWNFGDGATSTQQNPSHAYAQAGTYTVTLTVTDKDGGSGSASTIATVQTGSFDGSAYITTPYLKIPNFGAHPTIVSVTSGNWSDPTVWSLGRVPADGDVVDLNPGTTVTYDVSSAAALNTVEVQAGGVLTFRTDVTTLMNVQNLVVLPGAELDIGTQANPVAAVVKAEVVFLNQPLNTALDPEQYGNGLIALGTVRTYGAVKAPYVTLSQEAHAGDTTLHLAAPAAGWRAGDKLQLPDTRQLPYLWTSYDNTPRWESPTVQNVSADGLTVTLSARLQYDHLGARDATGALSFLPHVADMTRNVSIHSQSATGTRGYALFTHRADVNVNYTSFGGMGRTRDSGFDDATFNTSGQVTHVGSNQENRNPVTFFHLFGPTTPQANGYQYTFIGNVVTCPLNPMPFIWGVSVTDSHYGLIQSNDVVNWNGAGVVVDGVSSDNVFDRNFVMRIAGTSDRSDQALQGDAFWFGNPNNYVTNNVATDINGYSQGLFSYGFSVDMTGGTTSSNLAGETAARVPAYQGADPSAAGQSKTLNMNDTPLLQFAGNQVYGATVSGMTVWWLGAFGDTPYPDARPSVVQGLVAWNFSNRAFYGYPSSDLVIDGLVVRGDADQLSNANNCTLGVTFDDYMARDLTIQNCDIQGVGTGVKAPYFVGFGSSMGTTLIRNNYLDNATNIDIVPPHSDDGTDLAPQAFNIVNDVFAHPSSAPQNGWWDIAMDYGGTGGPQMNVPQYAYVTDYNGVQGDDFQVYYSQSPSPTGTPPAGAHTRALIDGLVSP